MAIELSDILYKRFIDLHNGVAGASVDAHWNLIFAAYTEEHRFYHNRLYE